MPAKIRLTPTPYLDAWRPVLIAATAGVTERASLARFLTAQGRRSYHSNRNLVNNLRAASLVPNAEDFLAIQAWLATAI